MAPQPKVQRRSSDIHADPVGLQGNLLDAVNSMVRWLGGITLLLDRMPPGQLSSRRLEGAGVGLNINPELTVYFV